MSEPNYQSEYTPYPINNQTREFLNPVCKALDGTILFQPFMDHHGNRPATIEYMLDEMENFSKSGGYIEFSDVTTDNLAPALTIIYCQVDKQPDIVASLNNQWTVIINYKWKLLEKPNIYPPEMGQILFNLDRNFEYFNHPVNIPEGKKRARLLDALKQAHEHNWALLECSDTPLKNGGVPTLAFSLRSEREDTSAAIVINLVDSKYTAMDITLGNGRHIIPSNKTQFSFIEGIQLASEGDNHNIMGNWTVELGNPTNLFGDLPQQTWQPGGSGYGSNP